MELGFWVCAALSQRSSISNLNVVLAYSNIILEIDYDTSYYPRSTTETPEGYNSTLPFGFSGVPIYIQVIIRGQLINCCLKWSLVITGFLDDFSGDLGDSKSPSFYQRPFENSLLILILLMIIKRCAKEECGYYFTKECNFPISNYSAEIFFCI